jgi:hypothetical protein
VPATVRALLQLTSGACLAKGFAGWCLRCGVCQGCCCVGANHTHRMRRVQGLVWYGGACWGPCWHRLCGVVPTLRPCCHAAGTVMTVVSLGSTWKTAVVSLSLQRHTLPFSITRPRCVGWLADTPHLAVPASPAGVCTYLCALHNRVRRVFCLAALCPAMQVCQLLFRAFGWVSSSSLGCCVCLVWRCHACMHVAAAVRQ